MDQDPNQQYPGQSGYQGGYQQQGGDQQPGDYQQQSGGYQQANTGYQYQQQQQYGQSGGPYNMGNPHGPTSINLAPNISAALSYVFGWITGLIFFFGERRNRFVRFHAMQSILVFIALSIVWAIVRLLAGVFLIGWLFGCILTPIVGIASFLIWAGLILMAFMGKEVKIPIIGDYAARFSGQDRTL